ncbi:hypothetical protein ABXL05_11385, partial [Yersinia enterocolitica]
ETGYMAAIPERYFQEKTLGLLGASIYGGSSHQGRLFLQREYGVFMIYLFSPLRHFVNNLVYASHSSMSKRPTFPDVGFLFFIFHTENFASLSAI